MPGFESWARSTRRTGTQIYYKDWGEGRPVVFSHGWPLDAWEDQMVPHGVATTLEDQVNADLLAFIKG